MRRLPQHLHGPARVGEARQLHLDAVARLLADIRLGHAELVDTVADGAQGLIHGHVLQAVGLGVGEAAHETELARIAGHGLVKEQLRVIFVQQLLQLLAVVAVRQEELQTVAAHHAGTEHDDLFILSQAADILSGQRQRIADRLVHAHRQGQMDTALEVKAEVDLFFRQDRVQGRPDAGHAGQGIGKAQQKNDKSDAETCT